MKLYKFEHACFVVEKEDYVIVVDPGNLTSNLIRQKNVSAIVITHNHPDHFDSRIVTAILDENPEAEIFTTADVAPQLAMYTVHVPRPGERRGVGPFTLRFFGGKHAVIHSNIEVIDNIGVLIDEALYYPGDSFAPLDRTVSTLLLPVAAPWLKITEAIDFTGSTRAGTVIPTHDAILNDSGRAIIDGILQRQVAMYGGIYQRIDHRTPLEITSAS